METTPLIGPPTLGKAATIILLLVLAHPSTAHHGSDWAGEEMVLNVDGDIRLGALFPIHKEGDGGKGGGAAPCGEIQREDGIQPLEAMLFAVDEINSDPDLLPGVTLGVKAIDSCDNPFYAAERSLGLLHGFIARQTNLSCSPFASTDNSAGPLSSEWPCGDNIVGIIGPQTSSVSVEIAGLGRLFHVPQVSYLATSVALCSREQFPYFFRTVPSDKHQARAIVEILSESNWNYASIVHSDSDYGLAGYEALQQHVSNVHKLCLADPITIYNDHFVEADYEKVVRALDRNKMSRVVIVFADRVPAGKLLQTAMSLGMHDRFMWIGSDAWASRESVVQGREPIVEGAIAVQPLRRELPGYNEYFGRLVRTPNRRNPWFEEYLHHYHNCSNDSLNRKNLAHCNQELVLGLKNSQQLYIHFVRDAVYAFAHALHDLHEDACGPFGWGDGDRLCPEFKERVFRHLKDFLQGVKFPDVAGKTFKFYSTTSKGHGGDRDHDDHDGPPRYSIIKFQKLGEEYDWGNVATYDDDTGLDFVGTGNRSQLAPPDAVSRCQRRQCGHSEVKVQDTEDACCWHCRACSDLEIKTSEYECRKCPLGTRSDRGNRTGCVLIEETYLDYTNPWALTAIVFSLVGICMTLVIVVVFWRFWDTPVVKACGRELSLLLLLGTFLSFATTFVIVARPTPELCGLMRFFIGFCYTMCYAAVVTKTNRVARIFGSVPGSASSGGRLSSGGGGGAAASPRFTSPLSSLVIASVLIAVEVVINCVWLLAEPPSTEYLYNLAGERILVCTGVNDSFMAGLIYPFFLILCATLYAFKTRKCPGGFNETRFILFANTINTIHWIVYVPLYFASTDPEIRAVILAFSLSLSGMVQLACMLLPRVYTVIFKPEKNTRGRVMDKRKKPSVCHDYPATPPNSVALPVSFAGAAGCSDGLMTQMSTMSAPPPGAAEPPAMARQLLLTHNRFSSAVLNPSRVVERQPEFDKTSLPLSFANLQASRHMTWSFHSSQEVGCGGDPPSAAAGRSTRVRSSSVCKGTQTSSGGDSRRIKFTVSAPSDEDDFYYDASIASDRSDGGDPGGSKEEFAQGGEARTGRQDSRNLSHC